MKRIRILLVVITLFLLSPLYVPTLQTHAADTGEGPYYLQTFNGYIESMKMADEGKLHKEGGDTTSVVNNMNAVIALTVGTTDKDSKAFYYKKSTLAQMGNAMAFMYETPPASTYAFVEDMGQTLGFLPKKTYAADGKGSGYTGLLPILPIWKGFRNIAYGLLAVTMIVIGFMVMFRKKIDPKTVMTVQNSLPRIVVTLLLISFSYAIAGFLIDLMYVLILIGIQILDKSGMNGINATYLQGQYLNGGAFALFAGVMTPIWSFTNTALTGTISQMTSGAFLEKLTSVLGTLAFFGSGIGPLLQLLLSLAYLFVFIRILFLLFSCYIQILMNVIIAPLQLLLDVFPGSNQTTEWFKNIIANLLAFPITIFMLIIGDAIAKNFGAGLLWEPPLIVHTAQSTSIGSVGGISASLGQVLIWLGIITAIPTVVNKAKEALKAKPMIQGGGIPTGMIATPFAMTQQGLNAAFQINALTGLNLLEALGIGKGSGGGGKPKK